MKEALKLALAELLECRSVDDNNRGRHIAIAAIKDALAQPEQEPVAWWIPKYKAPDMVSKVRWSDECEPLYTTPPQRKPLTDEMIVAGGKALAKLHAESCGLDFDDVWKYYAEDHKADAKAAIEAAHGIKE
jgi:hypothetical protein